MKIAILGLSGNPTHYGHISTAMAASEVVDEVWLNPCWNHMFNKELASPHQRLDMCGLSVAGLDRIRVSDFDIKNQLSCGTYESLKILKNLNDGFEFLFVIGQDNADTIDKWRSYQKLIDEFRFIVVPRKGYKPTKTWYNDSRHIYLKDFMPPDISSTQIRQGLVAKNKSVEKFLHPDVLTYIQTQGLYQK